MKTISLCMIVKNEEKVLERCLLCCKQFADEIIVVDTGSVDNTKEIAKKFTDKVYDFEWVNDFGKARNFAFSKAIMDYQMWIDADDIVLDEDIKKIIELKNSINNNVDMVTMKYITHTDENNIPINISTRERLLKRENRYLWNDPVHEYIALRDNILDTDISILHKKNHVGFTDRNLNIYKSQIEKGIQLTPRSMYYYARELKDHLMYEEAIKYFNMFLDTEKGWFEDNIGCCFQLSICYHATNQTDKIYNILIKSFEYDSPRSEICCQLGYYYKLKQEYKKAINWFRVATNLEKPNTYGFILNDYYGYIPNLEICVCYSLLGDNVKAKIYNYKAKLFKPESETIKYNEKYFEKLEI